MKMNKKMLMGALLCGSLLLGSLPVNAESLPSTAKTPGSIVLEENDDPTKPVDPTDPTKPLEPEDPDNPGTGNEGPLSLDVAPKKFDFGVQKMYQTKHTYTGVAMDNSEERGDRHYLQVTDNREADVTGWTVKVKQDRELTDDGTNNILTGAYIKLPKADARNSLNVPSTSIDTSFTTVGGSGLNISTAEQTVFAPTSTTTNKGKATSTSLWKSSEVELTIPAGVAKAGTYTNNVEWSLTAGPTI
ncbi:WxL domain-containing protein [Enterococcus sp. ALS3]|uniref:WxL domain-containing protein n=1 Tax=Enterococcus alishanensis TaxID=1303817 RepID=A0ABS6T985_9ENTE|nr:WxL domain-containing protein [Enterococcus alishanensis]MBV7389462.1 WxL domain-containing protein [Enterococcus alishanensis]